MGNEYIREESPLYRYRIWQDEFVILLQLFLLQKLQILSEEQALEPQFLGFEWCYR